MRVMTYNILRGGLPIPYGGKDRLEKIVSVIQKYKPDVLALQEANRFDDQKIDLRLAHLLGLPYFSVLKAPPFEDGQ